MYDSCKNTSHITVSQNVLDICKALVIDNYIHCHIVISFLQGLKANMKRLYHLVTEQQFARCTKPEKYKKLLFALCFFHSVLLERKKFLMLGWNIMYGFNDSDFEVRIAWKW